MYSSRPKSWLENNRKNLDLKADGLDLGLDTNCLGS